MFKCEYCDFIFMKKYGLVRHQEGRCKIMISNNQKETNKQTNILLNQNKKLIEEMNKIKDENKEIKDKITLIEDNKCIDDSKLINDKLLNIIINKDKKIEQLIKKEQNNIKVNIDNVKIDDIPTKILTNYQELKLNDNIITSRDYDKYVNATQLCKAGGKKFNDWYRLDSTKQLLNELSKNINKSNTISDTGIPTSQIVNIKKQKSSKESKAGIPALDFDIQNSLIDSKKGGNHDGTWIHPDLAIQLAQWISPQFALQVSSWIRTLFTNGKIDINLNILK